MLDAIERWARAAGIYWAGLEDAIPGKTTLSYAAGGFAIRVWEATDVLGECVSKPANTWHLDRYGALLWSTCKVQGRDDLALLLCDAAAMWGGLARVIRPPNAREDLAVEGDRLLAQGDPLGEWIAAWLRGECRACGGVSSVCDHTDGGQIEGYGCSDCMNTGHVCLSPCGACNGHGIVLGAYVDALTAALVDAADVLSFVAHGGSAWVPRKVKIGERLKIGEQVFEVLSYVWTEGKRKLVNVKPSPRGANSKALGTRADPREYGPWSVQSPYFGFQGEHLAQREQRAQDRKRNRGT